MALLGRCFHRLWVLVGLESHGRGNMKITFTWWSWRNGQNRKEIVLTKIKNGYPSKKSYKRFEQAVEELNGKKIRIVVKEV